MGHKLIWKKYKLVSFLFSLSLSLSLFHRVHPSSCCSSQPAAKQKQNDVGKLAFFDWKARWGKPRKQSRNIQLTSELVFIAFESLFGLFFLPRPGGEPGIFWFFLFYLKSNTADHSATGPPPPLLFANLWSFFSLFCPKVRLGVEQTPVIPEIN